MIRSTITGVGSYLPQRVVSNHDLARLVDTSDEWIVARTGIRERHIAADGELTSDLATAAARAALEHAGLAAAQIDLIILATATPDQTFPATAATVQDRLGIHAGAAFDRSGRLFRFHLRPYDRRLFPQGRPVEARSCHRRRDVLAHPGLERPFHLRAVRRRCGRHGYRDGRGPGNGRRSRHSRFPHPLRWPVSRQALCRWRTLEHPDGWTLAHGGPRSLSPRDRQHQRGNVADDG